MRKTTAVDMVAVFLRGEMSSPRFAGDVEAAAEFVGVPLEVLASPDIHDPAQSGQRAAVLAACRGWPDREVFAGLPRDTRWYRVRITRDDICCSRYMDYSYWIELSGGTRIVRDGAARVRSGVTAFGGVRNGLFHRLAALLEAGAPIHPLIVVGVNQLAQPTILEGHARATAIAMARPECLPTSVDAVLGTSPDMGVWTQ